MSKSTHTPPIGVRALNQRISAAATAAGQTETRLRSAVATTVLAQMLPAGAVKGGAAMKLRFGPDQTRFSTDVDVAVTL